VVVAHFLDIGMTIERIVIDGHFGVGGKYSIIRGFNNRVYLKELCIRLQCRAESKGMDKLDHIS